MTSDEGVPFKLTLRKDTVWYRVKELEGILKQINEIADEWKSVSAYNVNKVLMYKHMMTIRKLSDV